MAASQRHQNWRDVLAFVKRDFRGWQFWVTFGGIFGVAALCGATVAFLLWTCLRLGNSIVPWTVALGGIFGIVFCLWDATRQRRWNQERRLAGLERLPTQWLRMSWCLWLILLGSHGAVAAGVWRLADHGKQPVDGAGCDRPRDAEVPERESRLVEQEIQISG